MGRRGAGAALRGGTRAPRGGLGANLHTPPPKVTAEFHLEALRTAGFRETGTVWRYLDDVVLCAVR